MNGPETKRITVYRFTCPSCGTNIEFFVPFRRKPCPLCGTKMIITSVASLVKRGQKGGEEKCRSGPDVPKKSGP